MNLLIKGNDKPERSEDVGQALMQLIEENLKTAKWGFHLTFKKFDKTSSIKLIYDSKLCRVKFMFSRQRIPQQDEMSVEYGRLHAPNEEPYMEWQGKKCRCWHNGIDAVRFLDGLSPSDALLQIKIHKVAPIVVENFKQSEIGKKLSAEYPPKSLITLHSVLWQHYNQRLFDVFDIHNPDLWEKYSVFIKELYGLMGIKSSFGPSYENIC